MSGTNISTTLKKTNNVKAPTKTALVNKDGYATTAFGDFLTGLTSLVTQGAAWPIGGYMASATPPGDNWLECDGSAVSQSDYPDLYKVLSAITAPGAVSGTFKLPGLTAIFDEAHPAPDGPAVLRWFIRAT